MVLEKFNKGTGFDFQTPKDFNFMNLSDLAQDESRERFLIKSMFINTKGKYGDNPVIVTDKELVNIPEHMLDTIKEMIATEEVVNLVNNDGAFFEIYEYTNQWGANYSIRFIEDLPF